jgi:tetratricopeptide (TPR) repeat protein
VVAIFQSWRFKLCEVQEALKVGRLDDAERKLHEGGLLEYLPAKRLAEQLSLLFSERAKRRAQSRDFAGAWKDLDSAVQLAELPGCDVARRCLMDESLEAIDSLARGGDLASAVAQLDQLQQRVGTNPRVQALRKLVQSLQSARHLTRRGKFGDAESHLNVALGIRPDSEDIQRQLDECRTNAQRCCELSEQLYRALSESSFREAVGLADQLLRIAPEMKLARDARRKAWQKVGADGESLNFQSTHAWGIPAKAEEEAVDTAPSGPRFLLWVDGVGGFLVCLGDEVVLGRSTPGKRSGVDIPVLGDLSQKHARIRRSGEGYVIDPLHPLAINGKTIHGSTALCDGDELELGGGVRFRFRRPHGLSASARLEPISRHRLQPYADAILLMAESCVLGPKWSNHVVCRDWSADLVLYRCGDGLFCRSLETIEVDGEPCDGRGRLEPGSRIVGADFSLSLEELDKCTNQSLV